jgi:DNA-directed RNA polymerase subunit L
MEIKIIQDSKNELKFEIDSITIAEVLRTYLNEDSDVELAVWKQEHPTKNPLMLVKTKGKTAKKAVDDAVTKISKEADKLVKEMGK